MKRFIPIILLMIIVFSGCGNSSWITSSWKAQDAYPKKYNKIMVLALIRDADRSIRERMEQHIVGDLQELGYNAVCSCDEYNPKFFESMNEQQAIEKLRNSGVDAVLTISLLDKTKERYYVPGRVYYTPYYVNYNRLWGYYRTINQRIYTEGYYGVNTKYFWESNFYDMDSNHLMYSVQSQSFDPVSTESMSHEYSLMIIKNMVKSDVLANQRTSTIAEPKPME